MLVELTLTELCAYLVRTVFYITSKWPYLHPQKVLNTSKILSPTWWHYGQSKSSCRGNKINDSNSLQKFELAIKSHTNYLCSVARCVVFLPNWAVDVAGVFYLLRVMIFLGGFNFSDNITQYSNLVQEQQTQLVQYVWHSLWSVHMFWFDAWMYTFLCLSVHCEQRCVYVTHHLPICMIDGLRSTINGPPTAQQSVDRANIDRSVNRATITVFL